MDSAVRDPVLLCHCRGGVNDKLVRFGVEGRRRLHFDRVVPIAQLGQPKAADLLEAIDLCRQKDTRARPGGQGSKIQNTQY